MSEREPLAPVPEEGPLLERRPMPHDARFDITAMIDLVFMMNIYFLVTSIVAAMAEVDLPPAEHGVAADVDACVVVTILAPAGAGPADVFLEPQGEGDERQPLTTASDDQLQSNLEAALQKSGKSTVLIKAERNVLHRDVSRVAAVVGRLEGIALNLAVLEYE